MGNEFQTNLNKYADVILKVGVNLQPGQRLLIGAPTALTPLEAAPLVRLLAEKAYRIGARLVDVMWGDEGLRLARVQSAGDDTLEEFPNWQLQAVMDITGKGDARIAILAEDPNLYKGQDPQRVGRIEQSLRKKLKPYIAMNPSYSSNWLVISVPVPGWSASLFPGLSPEEQEAKLWETIFRICRIDGADPVADWQRHLDDLAARSRYLQEKQYVALKYRGPGTDLTVGLPEGHVWQGGSTNSRAGIVFTPNLPTEEVFTLAHAQRVDGVVAATRPFSFGGGIIEGARFTFAGGQVVDFSASGGEAVLRSVLDADPGARRLGEAALVPNSSPISRSGLVFNNILFDENASSHLALGRAYKASLRGGVDMDDDAFQAAGGNSSNIHLDFMIGSGELDIDGVCADGLVEPVMRQGEWAIE